MSFFKTAFAKSVFAKNLSTAKTLLAELSSEDLTKISGGMPLGFTEAHRDPALYFNDGWGRHRPTNGNGWRH